MQWFVQSKVTRILIPAFVASAIMQTPKVLTKGREETLGHSCLPPEIRAVRGQVIVEAATLSHSVHSPSQIYQHANVA
jgi:hypothetical protein